MSRTSLMTKGNNYPFGSTQGGRGTSNLSPDNYRYGFNGKENDGEWGASLVQDYGFRLYNPGIGKFLSVDPLAPEYAMLTPYQFASNSPISGIDLDGLEYVYAPDGTLIGKFGESQEVRIVNADVVKIAEVVSKNQGKFPIAENMILLGDWGYTARYSKDKPILHDEFINIRTASAISLGGSAANDRAQAKDFFWVYYNRYRNRGTKGFYASTTYKKKKANYYLFEYELSGSEYSGPSTVVYKGETRKIEDHRRISMAKNPSNRVAKTIWSDIIIKMRNLDANNPYPGFENKGNIGDLNGENGDEKMWRMSRTYLYLKDKGKIDGSLIERVGSGSGTQFLFDLDGIEEFFDSNPQYDYNDQQTPKINSSNGTFTNDE